MCKHAEKENNLHDQMEIMLESMMHPTILRSIQNETLERFLDNTKVRQKKPIVII